MKTFTFIPIWVLQDCLIYFTAVITLLFIIRKEERPINAILEMLSFSFLYAAVYENFATLMGLYAYGRSMLMVFNVPLSVPIVEFLVLYTVLRLLDKMDVPPWTKPLLAGFSAMIFDFSLDPVSIKQVFTTLEGTVGRWTWFPGAGDVQIYGEPVYNFSGWVILTGYAAAFILLGRWWFRKSGYKSIVGYLYPVIAMLSALAVLVSPLSRFLLWLEPFFRKGTAGEWIMLVFFGTASLVVLLLFWKGRMKAKVTFADDYPGLLVLVGIPAVNLAIALLSKYGSIVWLEALALIVPVAFWAILVAAGKKKTVAQGGNV